MPLSYSSTDECFYTWMGSQAKWKQSSYDERHKRRTMATANQIIYVWYNYIFMKKEAIKIIYWLMSCILAEHMGSMWSCENSADFCIRFLFKYTRRSRNCFHVTQISNEQEPGNVTVNGFYITLYDLCRSDCSNTLRGCVILFLSDVPSLPACPLFTPPHIKLLHVLVIRKWPE